MKKTRIKPAEFAAGDCICFYCEDVNDCEHRSRYFCDCGHFKAYKPQTHRRKADR